MWPIVVVILSVPLLKQPIGRVSLAGIAVSFFGVLVISTRGDLLGFSLSDPIGTALAVGSAFIWAAFWLSNVRDDRDEVVKLLVSFVFGLAFVSAAAFALAGPPPLDPRGIGGSVYVGVFEMGVTFVLWMRALSLSADDGAGQQPRLPVALLIAGTHQRDRGGDDPAIVGDRAGVHHQRNRHPPLRPDRARGGLRVWHSVDARSIMSPPRMGMSSDPEDSPMRES